MANIDDFKARFPKGGLRPNRFKVTCNFPANVGGDNELASFMVKGASLPSSTIGTLEIPSRGGRRLKINGDRTFEPWTITVFNDDNMILRSAFERWSNLINSHEENVGLANPNDYQVDMFVEQLDMSDAVVKTYNIRGAWPSIIAPIELSFDNNDTIEEYDVTIEYQYWTSANVTT